MLATLLPGLREIRSPLVVGYAWLLALYLFAHGLVPDDADEAEARYGALLDLGDLLGRAGVAIVVSVGAYLLGGVMTQLSVWVYRVLEQHIDYQVWEPSIASLDRVLDKQLRRGPRELSEEETARLRDAVYSEADSKEVLDRLLLREKELYAESDRHRSEGELRVSIIWPACALIVGSWLAMDVPLGVGIGVTITILVIVTFLALDGGTRLARSREIVRYAIAAGVITTPALDALQEMLDDPRPLPGLGRAERLRE